MSTVRAVPSLPRRWYAVYAVALFTVLLAVAALVVPARSDAAPAATGTKLVGTLEITPGSCSGGKVTGTYLRMILPSGGANGPYLSNNDSACSDKSFTTLRPGTDGGLRIGSYQPMPSPPFGSSGDAKARRITGPTGFYGTNFSLATDSSDPQTRTKVPAPSVTVVGSTATADLRSFAVTWNNQYFNQGAPKPDGSTPGNTRKPTGTYDATTGQLTLSWTSQVVGGPFDKFTGSWHFEGRFVPTAGTKAPTTGTGGGTTTGGSTTGSTTGGTTGSSTPGAPVVPGAPSTASPGSPVVPGVTGTTAPVVAGQPVQAAPTTVKVVTKDRWKVSYPVLGIAIGIAVLGFGALLALSILAKRKSSAA
jgi:hypothetical protein